LHDTGLRYTVRARETPFTCKCCSMTTSSITSLPRCFPFQVKRLVVPSGLQFLSGIICWPGIYKPQKYSQIPVSYSTLYCVTSALQIATLVILFILIPKIHLVWPKCFISQFECYPVSLLQPQKRLTIGERSIYKL
jgi:hypothetical protein